MATLCPLDISNSDWNYYLFVILYKVSMAFVRFVNSCGINELEI